MGTEFAKVRDFFDMVFDVYILKDLKHLNSISSDEHGYGACAIPMALSIVTAIEMLGFLIREDNVKANKKGETSDNMSAFIDNFMNITESDKSRLIYEYRNGMAHYFFPQSTKERGKIFGIIKKATSNQLLFIEHNHVVILDVFQLYEHFLKAINKLKNKLFLEKDERLILDFSRGLKDTDYRFYEYQSYPFVPMPQLTATPNPIESKK